MRALSIRQPFAELILRGMKTVEYRSRPTRIIGERFFIYASRRPAGGSRQRGAIWSRDVGVADEPLPPWMVELAEGLRLWKPGELPTGVIVGSAIIERCEPMSTAAQPSATTYAWHLVDVTRLDRPRKPRRHAQPAWFNPF